VQVSFLEVSLKSVLLVLVWRGVMLLAPERCKQAFEKASQTRALACSDGAIFRFIQVALDWDAIAYWVANTHLKGVNDQVAQVLSAIQILHQVEFVGVNSIVLVSKKQVLVEIRLPFEEQKQVVIDVDLLDEQFYRPKRRWCCAALVVLFGVVTFVVQAYES
jgi:hypothetical protein